MCVKTAITRPDTGTRAIAYEDDEPSVDRITEIDQSREAIREIVRQLQ